MLIWGSKSKADKLGYLIQKCSACGNKSPFSFYVERKHVTLYFLPIIPYSKRRVIECGTCGALFELSKDIARRAVNSLLSQDELLELVKQPKEGAGCETNNRQESMKYTIAMPACLPDTDGNDKFNWHDELERVASRHIGHWLTVDWLPSLCNYNSAKVGLFIFDGRVRKYNVRAICVLEKESEQLFVEINSPGETDDPMKMYPRLPFCEAYALSLKNAGDIEAAYSAIRDALAEIDDLLEQCFEATVEGMRERQSTLRSILFSDEFHDADEATSAKMIEDHIFGGDKP